ncbi:EAL domain-containing protein [Dehalobacter sp. TBBPA1]|uniref:EAL domain-containing protein n=1 Tax=Dehalobacter sp. TBBPA1 TaxID=3235037 RepID=UPI0034A583CA
MKVTKNKTLIFVFIAVYYLFYLTATISQSDFWGNILSPVGALISFFLLLQAYYKSSQPKYVRTIWLFFSFASLSWAVGDFMWDYSIWILGIDPIDDLFVAALYFGTNLFLSIGSVIFALNRFRRWNVLQLLIDSLAMSVSILLLIWIIYFDANYENLYLVSKGGWTSAMSILLDIGMMTGIAIWFFSIRAGNIAASVRLATGAVLAFALIDLVYYYLYLHDLYIPNSVIDSVYMATLLGIALSALITPEDIKAGADDPELYGDYSNEGYRNQGLLLLVGPIIILFFVGFDIQSLLIYLIIIFLHGILSNHIQNSIRDQHLLRREKELNAELEKRIDERTRELSEKARELEKKNRQLHYLSSQDIVTKLYNRRFFLEAVQEKIKSCQDDHILVLLFLDIDRFKTINDVYGHIIGDKLIIALSKRLQKFIDPEHDLLARFGGDEFVLAFHGKYHNGDIENLAQSIISICAEPIQLSKYTFHITISVGISIYPHDASSLDALIQNSDIAMYEAKKIGFNKYVFFNEQINAILQRNLKLEILLRKAIYDKEFSLHYQPQFSIPDNSLIGIEALLRWNSPAEGSIPPSEFISIAEETDLIIPLGKWVINRAIRQIAEWNNRYQTTLKMGINVSIKQLNHKEFGEMIKSAIKFYAVPPEWIDMEITESIAIEDAYDIHEITKTIRDIGISVSIDDFGTGYSSLNHLKMFPFDRIKFSKLSIDHIVNDEFDKEIVRSIIVLANFMKIKTIAEGVETAAQYDVLKELGCDQIQGYYLAKPMPAKEFEKAFFSLPQQLILENSSVNSSIISL